MALAVNKSSRFLFLYARSRISKQESDIEGLGKGSVLVYFIGKNKTKQNKTKDKKTEIHRSNAVRKLKKKPEGSGHPLFIRLVSIDFPDFGSVGGVKNRNRKQKQKQKQEF